MVDFGETLKKLRLDAGLTQKQLADRLWLSKATVSYYEQSVRYPSPEVLVKLARVFHVTTDFLLGIEEKKQTLDVTDLTDDDILFLQNAISLLRSKNIEKSYPRAIKREREIE